MLACNVHNTNVLFAIRQVAAQLVGTTDHRKVVMSEWPIGKIYVLHSVVFTMER